MFRLGRSRSLTFGMSRRFHSSKFFEPLVLILCMLNMLLIYESEAVTAIGNCGGTLLDINGSFTSPKSSKLKEIFVHNNGSANLSCTWKIQPQQGMIKLVFNKIQVDLGMSNKCDPLVSLVIIDRIALSNNQPTETQVCKQELPYTYYSQGASLDVVLKGQLLHPYYKNYSFIAVYSTFDSTPTVAYPCGPCGGIISSDSGTVRSPRYPKNYPNNCNCKWTIYARSGYIIKLKFWEFSLEPEEGLICHDFVAIYDGSSLASKQLGKFCGKQSPGSLRTSGRYAVLFFHSDSSKTSTGFEVMYELSKNGEDLTSLRSIAAILGGVSFGIFIFLLLCSVIYKKYINSEDRRTTCPPSNVENDYLDAVQAAAPPSYQTVMADPEHYPRTPEVTPAASPVVTPSLLRRSGAHATPLVHHSNIHHLESLEEVENNGVETPPPPYPGENGEVCNSDVSESVLIEDLPPPPTYAMVSDSEEHISLHTWAPIDSEEYIMIDRSVDRRFVDSRDQNESSFNPSSTATQTTSCEDNVNGATVNQDTTRARCRGGAIDSHTNDDLCLQCIENSATARHAARVTSEGGSRGDYSLLRTDPENDEVHCSHHNFNRFSRRGHSAGNMRSRSGKKTSRFKGFKDRSLSVPSLNNRTERSDCEANHTPVSQHSPLTLRSLFSRRNQSHTHNRIQPNNFMHETQRTETTEPRSEVNAPTNPNVLLYVGDELSRSSHI